MEDKETIALYKELCGFLKKEKSEWKSWILGENEVNWAYSFEKNGESLQKPLPQKYHPIFYAVRREKSERIIARKVIANAYQEGEEEIEEEYE